MIDTFLMKLTLFQKAELIGKTFIALDISTIKFHFQNKKPIRFFATFTLLLFDRVVCLPFNKRNELNLKRNQKSNHEKSNIEQILRLFPEKKSPRPK